VTVLISVSHEFDWLFNDACLFVGNVVGLWSCALSVLIALIDFLLYACHTCLQCVYFELLLLLFIFFYYQH